MRPAPEPAHASRSPTSCDAGRHRAAGGAAAHAAPRAGGRDRVLEICRRGGGNPAKRVRDHHELCTGPSPESPPRPRKPPRRDNASPTTPATPAAAPAAQPARARPPARTSARATRSTCSRATSTSRRSTSRRCPACSASRSSATTTVGVPAWAISVRSAAAGGCPTRPGCTSATIASRSFRPTAHG